MDEPLQSTVYFKKADSFNDDQDSDNYIVGDRVWVDGIKAGYIQFLGETHFGRGEWAGVVLDDANGKNDGSVNGKHYFYCEPNRGVFCRLYRLHPFPKPEFCKNQLSSSYRKGTPDSGIYRDSPSPNRYSPILKSSISSKFTSPANRARELSFNGVRSRSPDATNYAGTRTYRNRERSIERPYSSASLGRPYTSSSLTRPSSAGSGSYLLPTRPKKTVTTVTSTTTTIDGTYKNGPLKVGDKVFVNSSKGVLSGRLRYLGKTSFGRGTWAGVHLDEPHGKNDGSVAGKRYFYCPYRYGLFTPSYKVAKADPKRMTTVTRVTRESPEI